MTSEDSRQFAAGLATLAEVFAEKVSEARAKAYFLALSDFDIATVQRAIERAARACRFFPKPVELREFIEGDPEDAAALAWARVVNAVVEVGTYATVDFGDPVLHAAVEAMGGWAEQWRLERMEARELGFRRAEFLRLYAALAQGSNLRAPGKLVGQHEAANRARGLFDRDAVVAIGPIGHAAPPALNVPEAKTLEPAARESE